jgi:hypothetical protein
VQFVFTKKPDGSYAAVLNSLDNEFIKNVAASAVSWQDGALRVEVPALSGSYTGALQDDHFEGQWSQAGSKAIPLTLSRPPQASQADVEALTGNWQGSLPGPAKVTVVFEFRPDEKGAITGTLAVPEQGALGIPLANLEVGAGAVSFKIPQIGGEYRGEFKGTSMTGSFKQGGMPQNGTPLNLTKTAIAPAPRLTLGGEAWNAHYGAWRGKVGQLDAHLYFTVNGMQQVAFMEVVQPKAGAPITAASVTGKKIVFKVAALGGEFSGDLAGNTLTGQWTQGGKTVAATWTKQ